MKVTLKDVKNSMPKEKAKWDSLWAKIWVRRFSNPLAMLAINANITPNTVSVISIIDTILACILMSIDNHVCRIIGLIVLNIFIVFDCMDGTMARTTKRVSYMGEFYDAMGGYTICAFSLLAAGICTYNSGSAKLFSNHLTIVLIMSAIGSICDIFSRLVYQKYTISTMVADYDRGQPLTRENDSFLTNQSKMTLTRIRGIIDHEFGVGGFYPPILLIAYFLGVLDVVVVLYSVYHILGFIAAMIIFSIKATKYDVEHRKNDK